MPGNVSSVAGGGSQDRGVSGGNGQQGFPGGMQNNYNAGGFVPPNALGAAGFGRQGGSFNGGGGQQGQKSFAGLPQHNNGATGPMLPNAPGAGGFAQLGGQDFGNFGRGRGALATALNVVGGEVQQAEVWAEDMATIGYQSLPTCSRCHFRRLCRNLWNRSSQPQTQWHSNQLRRARPQERGR